MKKLVSIVAFFLLLLSFSGCSKEADSIKFKKEYEAINDEVVKGTNNKVRSLTIPEDNPIVYLSLSDTPRVVKEETAIIYFGFTRCPWCRSMIETLLEVAKDLNIEKIYYVDISNSRDVLTVDSNGEVTVSKKAPDAYYELLVLLDDVLQEYVLTEADGNRINTGEKRIFAPSVVAVKDGEILGLESGIPRDQESPYQDITKKMHDETYTSFKNLFAQIISGGTCSTSKGC